MMKYLIAPLVLMSVFAATLVADDGAAADFAMIYGVLFVLSLVPASVHFERHR